MHRDAADVARQGGNLGLAEELGGTALVELIREDTHTCYLGERGARHEWGYGCGTCPACKLRAQGWTKYRAEAAA